jgi:hypothetical protein
MQIKVQITQHPGNNSIAVFKHLTPYMHLHAPACTYMHPGGNSNPRSSAPNVQRLTVVHNATTFRLWDWNEISDEGLLFLLGYRVARFFSVQHTKTGKIYQMTTKCTKWPYNIPFGCKIDKNFNIFNCKTLPKLGFLVWKYTIWQHRLGRYKSSFLMTWTENCAFGGNVKHFSDSTHFYCHRSYPISH